MKYLYPIISGFGLLLMGQSALAKPSAPQPACPIAYVRKLLLAPLAIAPNIRSPLMVGEKKRLPTREIQRRELNFIRLENQCRQKLIAKILSALSKIPYLTTIPINFTGDRPPTANPANGWKSAPVGDYLDPDPAQLLAEAKRKGADAVCAMAISRFETKSASQRTLAVQLKIYLARPRSKHLIRLCTLSGAGSTYHKFFASGYQRSDESLLNEAVNRVLSQLKQLLLTGIEPNFTQSGAIAYLPAVIPQFGHLYEPSASAPARLPLNTLARTSDVLFLPDLGPFLTTIKPRLVRDTMLKLDLRPTDLWLDATHPNTELVTELAQQLGCDYLVVARVDHIEVEQRPIQAQGQPTDQPRLMRHASARMTAAILNSSGKVIWRDDERGTTTSRTDYVRNHPRIRTINQCVADAVRDAAGRLLYWLDDFRNKGEEPPG